MCCRKKRKGRNEINKTIYVSHILTITEQIADTGGKSPKTSHKASEMKTLWSVLPEDFAT